MPTDRLWALTAHEQANGVASGNWTAEEVVRSVLERIDEVNPVINAFCTIDERALGEARRIDAARSRGIELGPLGGVPFSVKDLIPTAGLRTTLGSVAHRDWVPETDELAVTRLKDAGAILIGKTNTRELGYGVVTDNELFGPSRNPWNPELTPAGSSGGAAAALAAGLGSLSLGSDGGGSLRVPAAVCGVFSLKPTYGVVPLYPSSRAPLRVGLDSWESLECIGPITTTVHDAVAVLAAISQPDLRDRHSAPAGVIEFRAPEATRTTGRRVALSIDLGIAEVAPEVAKAVRTTVEEVADVYGWEIFEPEFVLPELRELRAAFAAIVAGDSDLAALRRLADQYPVSADIHEMLDHAWTPDEFVKARAVRLRVHEALWDVAGADVLITPTTATPAFPIGQRFPADDTFGIRDGRQWSPFAFLANLTGQPAATVPAGRTTSGLPIGLQIFGRRYADMDVLDFARAFELAAPWPRFSTLDLGIGTA